MWIVLPEEMRNIENRAVEERKIPSVLLMENGAAGVYQIIKQYTPPGSKGLVFAGGGNNGGDALAVARRLHAFGMEICVKLLVSPDTLKGDAKINYDIISEAGIFTDTYDICGFDFIVDGIFGTGLNRQVSSEMQRLFLKINQGGIPVYSIDVPSGLCARTGNILGGAVRATRTVTMEYPKAGLFMNDGPDITGELDIAEIGLPQMDLPELSVSHMDETKFKTFFTKRRYNSNKGSYGKVFCIGGCNEMRGAMSLAAKGAFAAGAGLVYAGVTADVWDTVSVSVPEAIGVIMKGNDAGCISSENIGKILETAESMDAVLIGPGMSNTSDTGQIVKAVTEALDIPVIIDADGINAIATGQLNSRNVILTPHPGEAARLLGRATEAVQQDRLAAAVEIANRYHAKVILKGVGTIITDGVKHYLNTTGNPSLAVAGTGDVLSGIVASLVCKRNDIVDMAACGAFLHGLAADEAVCRTGTASMTAGKLIPYIEGVMKKLER